MKTLIAATLLLASFHVCAIDLADYKKLSAAAAAGDTTARRLRDSFVTGATQGILVVNAANPIDGLCLPQTVSMKPSDIDTVIALVASTSRYKGFDPAKMPVSRAIYDGLLLKYPCRGR